MQNKAVTYIFLCFGFMVLGPLIAQEQTKSKWDWYGYLGADVRYFHDKAAYENQEDTYFSSIFKPQAFFEHTNHQIHFTGFARIDQHDNKRTRWDIRDFYWRYHKNNWEINAGIKTVTWGKTESNNLVDIINQYDLLEGRDLEHKLGQPLIQTVYAPSWGIMEFFVITWHRPVEFPGEKGRLRPPFDFHKDNIIYELDDAEYIPDLAIRFSKYINNIDFAVSHFYGTSRLPQINSSQGIQATQYYEQIHQTGFEIQWLLGSYALKGEFINGSGKKLKYQAFTFGNEYNLYFLSGVELKIMAEYTYDNRGEHQINGLDNDLFLGFHLNKNDINNTRFLIAGVYDLVYGTTLLKGSAERRIGNNWKVFLNYNGIFNTGKNDFYNLIRNDSHLEVGFLNYF